MIKYYSHWPKSPHLRHFSQLWPSTPTADKSQFHTFGQVSNDGELQVEDLSFIFQQENRPALQVICIILHHKFKVFVANTTITISVNLPV